MALLSHRPQQRALVYNPPLIHLTIGPTSGPLISKPHHILDQDRQSQSWMNYDSSILPRIPHAQGFPTTNTMIGLPFHCFLFLLLPRSGLDLAYDGIWDFDIHQSPLDFGIFSNVNCWQRHRGALFWASRWRGESREFGRHVFSSQSARPEITVAPFQFEVTKIPLPRFLEFVLFKEAPECWLGQMVRRPETEIEAKRYALSLS
jgi:hypothetical protein